MVEKATELYKEGAARLEFRETVATDLQNPTFEDRRRWLEILQAKVKVTNGRAVVNCRLGGNHLNTNFLSYGLQQV